MEDNSIKLKKAVYEKTEGVQVGEDEKTQNVTSTMVFNGLKGTYKITALLNSAAIDGSEENDSKVLALVQSTAFALKEKGEILKAKWQEAQDNANGIMKLFDQNGKPKVTQDRPTPKGEGAPFEGMA